MCVYLQHENEQIVLFNECVSYNDELQVGIS